MTNTNEQHASPTNPLPHSPQRATAAGATLGQNGTSSGAQPARPMPMGETPKGASPLASEARDLASQVTTSAKELMVSEVEKRASQGADDLSGVARALRESGKELHGNRAGPYVEKAAEKIDDFSAYLRTASPTRMLASVQKFARHEPLLFLGGAFALGLFGSRFLKSGRPDSSKPASPTSRMGAR